MSLFSNGKKKYALSVKSLDIKDRPRPSHVTKREPVKQEENEREESPTMAALHRLPGQIRALGDMVENGELSIDDIDWERDL